MARGTGILLDENNNLQIVDGSVVIGSNILQSQRIIIEAAKGEIKEDPLLGAGIAQYLDDDDPAEMLREVRVNLRRDGQKVKICRMNGDELQISSKYED